MTTRRVLAATLSMFVPGSGQLVTGRRRRAAVFLVVSVLLAAGGAVWLVRRGGVPAIDRRLVVTALLANAAVLAFRAFAVADAWRLARGASRTAVAALTLLLALTAVPHVAAGYVTVRGYSTLETVFADAEPADVLPSYGLFLKLEPPRELELPLLLKQNPARASAPLPASRNLIVDGRRRAPKPWTTMLLLGTDQGPGNWGSRTDTMIVVALQHGTGRAAAFGIPRNLVDVQLGGEARELGVRRFRNQLNGLYGFARSRPELFPGGTDAGATALKQTVSRLLGIRIDYYALVNLVGFADLVDALGGVTIHVKERLVDSVTRPAWGEPKPRIDVYPGQTVHMGGRLALAYVRSRKASSDYRRMARQRCFLGAMAQQLDPFRVLRNFGQLTRTVERNVHTDVPLDRLPSLVRLASRIDSRLLLTETFGAEYIAKRRKTDGFPVPDVTRMRATVRRTLLDPVGTQAAGQVAVIARSC